jgi:Mn-dependent DtxR family transcriptional regulator
MAQTRKRPAPMTPTQQRAYQAIKSLQGAQDFGISISDVARVLNKSWSGANGLVLRLEEKGRVERTKGKHRSLVVVEG